ncbi:hypothetical protein BABINDRAFT_10609 [Babjeviella inositovora NRRL Y-12698]|uniref:F-box domain-containing protein n=1 Tax=Babjeviella inositovora NRRL Y-12698 TaxID=984486 RepID=A0A1E3QIK2_9ASCO|nr:uncharacterized protein BABINDRAFT_10609 [Babjeviella inositovora NRRL Y-12698]ODQ76912.1 hypothetical protein BABINDRAFT_10609 [Babjeviella inositovora NRRL Y-12698]
MDTHEIPLFGGILPLEIVEKIVSYLPLSTVADVMNPENASLALVARRRYYSSIILNFDESPYEYDYSRIYNEVLIMKASDFEALKLELAEIRDFSVEAFNELNLPNLKSLLLGSISLENFNELRLHNLKYLRLKNVSGMTEIYKHFKFPSLLENLELCNLKITSFEQRSLPLKLQKLSINYCPLKKFRVDVFPDSFKDLTDLNLRFTNLVSVEELDLPPTLNTLNLSYNKLVSVDGLSLPLALTSLDLSSNKLVSVEGLDIPPTLIIFNLRDNNLELLSKRLPDNIQLLNLEHNQLKKLVNFHLPMPYSFLQD